MNQKPHGQKVRAVFSRLNATNRQAVKFRFIELVNEAPTKAFPSRGRCPEGADEVEKFRFRPTFHINETFYCTPHQSASLTASPRGEALACA